MERVFVRQRRHVGQGDKRPRFVVIAVEGSLTFLRPWLRKAEIEQIAQATGAEVVYLPSGAGEHGHQKPE